MCRSWGVPRAVSHHAAGVRAPRLEQTGGNKSASHGPEPLTPWLYPTATHSAPSEWSKYFHISSRAFISNRIAIAVGYQTSKLEISKR